MPNPLTTARTVATTAAKSTLNAVRRVALPMNMWAGSDIEAQASRIYPQLRPESLKELCEANGGVYLIDHMPAWRVPGVRPQNRPGRIRPGFIPKKDTFHGTANRKAGANARMHRRYVGPTSWGGPDKTSYHHVVDSEVIIELMPWWEVAFHGGTGQSNEGWLGTEACEDPTYGMRTIENMAILFAAKRFKFGKPREWIVQHNAAYGKDCPGLLRRGNPITWAQFLVKGDGYYAALERKYKTMPQPKEPTSIVLNGQTLSGNFLNFFRTHGGVQIFGLPLGPRHRGKVGTWEGEIQWFERARMEDHGGVVMLGLVGAEAQAAAK
jgi:hypothetical protein